MRAPATAWLKQGHDSPCSPWLLSLCACPSQSSRGLGGSRATLAGAKRKPQVGEGDEALPIRGQSTNKGLRARPRLGDTGQL